MVVFHEPLYLLKFAPVKATTFLRSYQIDPKLQALYDGSPGCCTQEVPVGLRGANATQVAFSSPPVQGPGTVNCVTPDVKHTGRAALPVLCVPSICQVVLASASVAEHDRGIHLEVAHRTYHFVTVTARVVVM